MVNFWDFSVWGTVNLFGILLFSLLLANMLRRNIKFLERSLIPVSVIGGVILLVVAGVFEWITGTELFDTTFFGGDGSLTLELITYHALALGFVASTLKKSKNKISKNRTNEIFNTGITTVSTYLLQAILGLCVSLIAAAVIPGFFKAAGALLPFGYGQGTGQALNYGNIYECEFGFVGGKSFGLTIAALGFISAAIGGVIHLNLLRRKKTYIRSELVEEERYKGDVEDVGEIPMQESIDKFTIQVAMILVSYLIAYGIMFGLGTLLPGMKSVIYGFNFLLGVLAAMLVKLTLNLFRKAGFVRKEYTNNFLLTRASNFFFDIMVVAGIAAIRLDILQDYLGIILIMGVLGALVTYYYNRLVAVTLFRGYREEQFLSMYGMLTGTASTSIILLREIDGDFKTPAADNIVYQNIPAIVLGFPMMFLATLAPQRTILCLLIFAAYFVLMNLLLFRSKIFRHKK